MPDPNDDTPGSAPTPETHQGGSNASPERARDSSRPARTADEGAPSAEGPRSDDAEPPDGTDRNDTTDRQARLDRVQGGLEAILFAADEPLPREALLETYDGVAPSLVDRALERLELEYSGSGRGVHLERVADGFQFRTNPEFGDAVRQHVEANPVSLSRAAMETLAIVAYRQPVTRAEIDDIRGVDSSGVVRTLTEYDLVRVVGRLDDLGRPHVYGTTDRFLEIFGLDDLTELPTLSEDEHRTLDELYQDEMEQFDEQFE